MDNPFTQSILDTLPAHIALVDENGKIVVVNKAWKAFAVANGNPKGATVGVGANYLDAARLANGPYSEEGAAAHAGVKAVLDGSLPQFTLEYPCHSLTERRWFRLTVSPLEKTPRMAVVSHLDITPRIRLEKRLEESAERFYELVDHLHQVFWIYDPKTGGFPFISPAYETIWGRSCQSLYENPQGWTEVIHPEDRARVIRLFAQAMQAGHYDAEYRIVRPDGAYRWIWARGYPVRDASGVLTRQVGLAEDITERKTAEEENAKMAAIIEYADDAIVSMTLDGIVISWNLGAERLYGYTAEEIIGHSILMLNPPDKSDEYAKLMARVRKGERVGAIETLRLRKDGTPVPVSLTASPIEIRAGKVTVASKISHDITRIKHLEEQFRQAQKMEAVGTLAAGVAHDFNNLLTIINGYSELIIDELPNEDPNRAYLMGIHEAGERAGILTRQLLAFSRKQMLESKVLNFNAIVTDTEKMLRRLIGEDIVLTTILDPAVRPVIGDPGQIQQVLMNLSVNARDAMPQGGQLTIETHHVTLDESYHRTHPEIKPGQYAMIAVSDTGTGMDAATQARIFEPFFTTKGVGKGTGLGMAVVHGVVRQSGGMIEVYSELEKGTVFKLYFPAVEAPLSAAAPSRGSRKMPAGTETILLVEDEDGVRALARKILHSCGYHLLEARDGKEAVTLAEGYEKRIHLLLTDVVMPLLGGRQLAEQLEITRPGIRVLFLSGYTDDAVVRHGILQAEVAFLQKPFSPIALAQKVRDVLDGPAAQLGR
ncbi:MAG: PAS domain S-box protein [Burkholderiales bacterium]|nr:PAS domain S-box protein [Phycisphaerae bacterium]